MFFALLEGHTCHQMATKNDSVPTVLNIRCKVG